MKRSLSLGWGALFAGMLLGASSAHAHIVMEGALKSRTTPAIPLLDNTQKMFPCDGAPGTGPVYTFQPGTTITLSINESVQHPSYFRIAFDNDGEDAFKEPASIMPIDKTRMCPFDKDDQCGKSDFCNMYDPNGPRVLWDNLNPHATGGDSYTWNVKLPDMECENCTLQVIQVMEDTVHGAYCPHGCANSAASLEDIYHRCINIKLKKGATNSPGTTTSPVNNMGIDCAKAPMTDAGAPVADAGAAGGGDAGTKTDAGAAAGGGTTGGGTVGAAGGGTTGGGAGTAGGGTTGGGTVATAGGAAGGAAGTAGTGTAGGGATTAGTVPAGGTAGGAPTTSDDDNGGCSVSFRGNRSAAWAGLLALAIGGTLMRRRRR